MSEKLDPRLLQQLDEVPDPTPGTVNEETRTRVLVTYQGDAADLADVGLEVESTVGDIVIGWIKVGDLERLAALDGVVSVESDRPVRPQLKGSVPAINADDVRTGPLLLDGAGVFVGVIDTGIDIFHHSFRDETGFTRIHSIWDQTLTPDPGENAPAGFTTGVEYTGADIQAALDGGSIRHVDADGHGTHVAGTAAGDGSQSGNCEGANTFIGVAPAATLVIVKTTFQTADLLPAVQYIFQQAGARAAVANLSLGGQFGAHDGTRADERGIDALLAGTTGRAVVISAGNDGELGLHAFDNVAANGSRTFTFEVPPNDMQDDWFDIWYSGAARLRFTLTPPAAAGTPSGPVNPGDAPGTQPVAGCSVFVNSRLNDAQNGKHEIAFRISPPTGGSTPTGPWTITLTETAGTATDVDCWINLEATDVFPQFVQADRDRTRTVTMPGTARNVITVGAFDYRDNALAGFSSRGPTTDLPTPRRKPEIAAPGVGIVAPRTKERSVWYCSDCCQDFYIPLDGTSMAAPHVTGVVALVFHRNRTLTFDQVRAHIEAAAQPPDPITAPTLPNNEWGAGMVDAAVTVAAVPAGPSGGGGGSMLFRSAVAVPPAAVWPAYLPNRARLRWLPERLCDNPAGALVAALVSTHFDEVLRLVSTNRRVAVVWHRLGGAALLRHALSFADGGADVLPSAVQAHLPRMVRLLAEYGSPQLRADVDRYGPFFLALPGSAVGDLPRLLVAD